MLLSTGMKERFLQYIPFHLTIKVPDFQGSRKAVHKLCLVHNKITRTVKSPYHAQPVIKWIRRGNKQQVEDGKTYHVWPL